MVIREEKFDPKDLKVIEVLFSKHLRSFWLGLLFIIFLTIIGPLFHSIKGNRLPETMEEYGQEVLVGAIFLTGAWIYFFYTSKKSLLKDQKEQTKEILLFEVTRKERFFQENTFYIFLDGHEREEISWELYETLKKGDKITYQQAKYSKERLSLFQKFEKSS